MQKCTLIDGINVGVFCSNTSMGLGGVPSSGGSVGVHGLLGARCIMDDRPNV
jgi:hypothetical protein|nr:hypothetical protein Q903MT_gene2984 [Picea sitchensis]